MKQLLAGFKKKLTSTSIDFNDPKVQQYIALRIQGVSRTEARRRSGIGHVVAIAIELILFATIGFVGLQLLATSSTTSFQPTVVIIAITVVSIVAALAVAVSFLKRAGVNI